MTIEEKAKKAYNNWTSNHPTIHCNRFCAWEELSEITKSQWIKAAEKEEDNA